VIAREENMIALLLMELSILKMYVYQSAVNLSADGLLVEVLTRFAFLKALNVTYLFIKYVQTLINIKGIRFPRFQVEVLRTTNNRDSMI
jgi:hypothetical protein